MHQELLRFLKGKGTAAALLGVAVFSYYYKNRENKTSIRDRHLLTEQQRTVLKTGISLITLAWLFNKVRPYYKPFIYFATAIHQFQNRLDKLAPTAEHLRTLLCSYQRLMEPNQQNHRQLEQIKRIGTTAASRLEAIAANEYIVPLSPTMKTMLKEILQSKKIRNHLDPSNTNRLEFLRSQRISGMTKEMSPFYVFGGPSGVGKTASLSELSDILTHSFGIRTVLHDLSAADKWDKEAKVLIGDIEKADRFAGTRGVVAIITIHEFDNIFNSSLTDETNKQNALKKRRRCNSSIFEYSLLHMYYSKNKCRRKSIEG